MKVKPKHIAIASGGLYVVAGLVRGAHVASKYPSEAPQRGFGWWLRAALAWPYDAAKS